MIEFPSSCRDATTGGGPTPFHRRKRGLREATRFLLPVLLFCGGLLSEAGSAPPTGMVSSNINASPVVRLTLPPSGGLQPEPIDLSGSWLWKRSWTAGGIPPEEPDAGWVPIRIPSEYGRQGERIDGVAALYRTFVIPSDWIGSRIKMRFDAVNNGMTLRINGETVGSHDGFLLPFEFDVTDHLRFGSTNRVLVELTENGVGARMADRLRQGGVIRKVTLFPVPPVNITECYTETLFEPSFRDARLRVVVGLSNDQAMAADGHRIRIRFRDPSGRAMDSMETVRSVPALPSLGSARQVVDLYFAAPAKWDAEHPRLHEMTVDLEAGGRTVETVVRKVGFRQVDIVGDQVWVNGRPIKVRGILRFDQFQREGSAVPERIDALDPVLFRDANCNYLRSWPSSDRFYDSCDEAGVFVHGELPISFQAVVPQGGSEDFLRVGNEILNHVRHHPSVLFWSLGNESQWSAPFADLARHLRREDPTRPIFDCQPFGDTEWQLLSFDSAHYPLLDMGVYSNRFRPVFFTEYHHVNSYRLEENIGDPGVRDYWGGPFRRIWENMYAAPSVLGGCVFAGVDYEDLQYGDLPWGVVDRDRRPKPEYWHLKKVYSPVQIRQEAATPDRTSGEVEVRVENRHDFSNLSELRSEWRIDGRGGELVLDIPSRGSGMVRIPVRPGDVGRDLWLRFQDVRGFLVDEYRLPIGSRPETPTWRPTGTGGAQLSRTGPTSVEIEAGAARWRVDESKGRIVAGSWNGIEVLKGGPDFWMTGLEAEGWPGWHVESRQLDQSVEVRVTTDAPGGIRTGLNPYGLTGTLTYRFTGGGNLDIDYDLAWSAGFSWWYRELGMSFVVTPECSDWSWRRNALWSVYPAWHIGRPSGRATLSRDPSWGAPSDGPAWPWSLDEAGGTADFRSTKYGIRNAALTRTDRIGVVVESDGRQAARVVAPTNGIGPLRLVVNEVSGIGTEQFLTRVFPDEVFLMVTGNRFSGRVRLALSELASEAIRDLEPSPARPEPRLVRSAPDTYRIRMEAPIHRHPRIQRSTDLRTWLPATNAYVLDGESVEVRIPSAGGGATEFYRAAP